MLAVLFGVSCAGRTSVINKLCQNLNWQQIPVYTTRVSREAHIEVKKTVSEETFTAMEQSGSFFCVTNVYNNRYGFSKKEIERAISSNREKWIMDFALSNAYMLKILPFVGIYLMPESEQAIVERLESTNRSQRKDEVLSRFHKDKLDTLKSPYIDKVVFNKNGKLDVTVKMIESQVLKKYLGHQSAIEGETTK